MPLCICIFLCCLQWWQALTKDDSWVLYHLLVSLQPVIKTHNCLHVTTLYLTGWYSLSSSSWMYCDLYNLSLIMLYCRCAKNTTLQEKKNWLRPKLMQWETNQSSHINAFMYMHFSMLLIQWWQALTKDDSWVESPASDNESQLPACDKSATGWYSLSSSSNALWSIINFVTYHMHVVL